MSKHPVDVHVGARIRHRRWRIGMTQQGLAEAVGIKFQQIQKYESGTNRVSASRLWDIARAQGVPVSYYFEGLEGGAPAEQAPAFTREEAAAARRLARVAPPVRRAMLGLAAACGQ